MMRWRRRVQVQKVERTGIQRRSGLKTCQQSVKEKTWQKELLVCYRVSVVMAKRIANPAAEKVA
jgi:hypothetical protein